MKNIELKNVKLKNVIKNVELENDFVIRLREAVKKYKEKNQSNNE